MFLKEITLQNFKCHGDLKLSFTTDDKRKPIRKTTFMLGQNGTGKSALLKAIALITSGSNGLSDIIGEPEGWIKNGKSYCEITSIITTEDGKERNIKLRITGGHSLREIIFENRNSLELIDDAIKKADRNYFVVGYGASRRLNRGEDIFQKSSSRFTSPRSVNIQSLFDPGSSLVSLANWAMELDYSRQKGGMGIIKNALNQFLVDNVEFKSIDKKKKTLIFSTPDGEVPLEHLSDGYQNVTAWVGDLMYNITNTFKDYKDPMKARGVLLIDEIDLHLHPKWQRLLHKFLKEQLPNFQVIATTHSPLTAQQAEEGELYALKRENKKVVLVPFVGCPSQMLIHQILMSPVFGLETDESVKVETAKEKVREVRLKEKPTAGEIKSIEPYEKLLSTTPINVRSNSLLGEGDFKLLSTINKELSTRKNRTNISAKKPSLKKSASGQAKKSTVKK
ncbi:MAG: ATP-binding protein [Ginsengibacter sp.]